MVNLVSKKSYLNHSHNDLMMRGECILNENGCKLFKIIGRFDYQIKKLKFHWCFVTPAEKTTKEVITYSKDIDDDTLKKWKIFVEENK